MTAKALIKKLQSLPPNTKILIRNGMGCPAYDYDGQRFVAGFDGRTKTIKIVSEVNSRED